MFSKGFKPRPFSAAKDVFSENYSKYQEIVKDKKLKIAKRVEYTGIEVACLILAVPRPIAKSDGTIFKVVYKVLVTGKFKPTCISNPKYGEFKDSLSLYLLPQWQKCFQSEQAKLEFKKDHPNSKDSRKYEEAKPYGRVLISVGSVLEVACYDANGWIVDNSAVYCGQGVTMKNLHALGKVSEKGKGDFDFRCDEAVSYSLRPFERESALATIGPAFGQFFALSEDSFTNPGDPFYEDFLMQGRTTANSSFLNNIQDLNFEARLPVELVTAAKACAIIGPAVLEEGDETTPDPFKAQYGLVLQKLIWSIEEKANQTGDKLWTEINATATGMKQDSEDSPLVKFALLLKVDQSALASAFGMLGMGRGAVLSEIISVAQYNMLCWATMDMGESMKMGPMYDATGQAVCDFTARYTVHKISVDMASVIPQVGIPLSEACTRWMIERQDVRSTRNAGLTNPYRRGNDFYCVTESPEEPNFAEYDHFLLHYKYGASEAIRVGEALSKFKTYEEGLNSLGNYIMGKGHVQAWAGHLKNFEVPNIIKNCPQIFAVKKGLIGKVAPAMSLEGKQKMASEFAEWGRTYYDLSIPDEEEKDDDVTNADDVPKTPPPKENKGKKSPPHAPKKPQKRDESPKRARRGKVPPPPKKEESEEEDGSSEPEDSIDAMDD